MRLSQYLDAMIVKEFPSSADWKTRYSHISNTEELKSNRRKLKMYKDTTKKK